MMGRAQSAILDLTAIETSFSSLHLDPIPSVGVTDEKGGSVDAANSALISSLITDRFSPPLSLDLHPRQQPQNVLAFRSKSNLCSGHRYSRCIYHPLLCLCIAIHRPQYGTPAYPAGLERVVSYARGYLPRHPNRSDELCRESQRRVCRPRRGTNAVDWRWGRGCYHPTR